MWLLLMFGVRMFVVSMGCIYCMLVSFFRFRRHILRMLMGVNMGMAVNVFVGMGMFRLTMAV
jgi:hypothetical protein